MPAYDVTIWMPFYIGEFARDSMALSAEEIGAAVLLQVFYWSRLGEAIPDEDERLARVTKLSLEKFTSIKRRVLEPFFKLTDTGWKSARLDALIEEARRNKSNNSARASKAAKARYNKGESAEIRGSVIVLGKGDGHA